MHPSSTFRGRRQPEPGGWRGSARPAPSGLAATSWCGRCPGSRPLGRRRGRWSAESLLIMDFARSLGAGADGGLRAVTTMPAAHPPASTAHACLAGDLLWPVPGTACPWPSTRRRAKTSPSSSSPPHRRHATRQRIRRPAHRAGGDGSLRAPADGASLHVAGGPKSCSRWSRIVSSGTPDSRSPSAAADLRQAHCYQGPRVKVTDDQIVDRATGSTLPLPTVTARAERLTVGRDPRMGRALAHGMAPKTCSIRSNFFCELEPRYGIEP